MAIPRLIGINATSGAFNWNMYHNVALELVAETYKLSLVELARTGVVSRMSTSSKALLNRELS